MRLFLERRVHCDKTNPDMLRGKGASFVVFKRWIFFCCQFSHNLVPRQSPTELMESSDNIIMVEYNVCSELKLTFGARAIPIDKQKLHLMLFLIF